MRPATEMDNVSVGKPRPVLFGVYLHHFQCFVVSVPRISSNNTHSGATFHKRGTHGGGAYTRAMFTTTWCPSKSATRDGSSGSSTRVKMSRERGKSGCSSSPKHPVTSAGRQSANAATSEDRLCGISNGGGAPLGASQGIEGIPLHIHCHDLPCLDLVDQGAIGNFRKDARRSRGRRRWQVQCQAKQEQEEACQQQSCHQPSSLCPECLQQASSLQGACSSPV